MRKNRANIETKKKALKQCIHTYRRTDGRTDKVICRGRAKKTVLNDVELLFIKILFLQNK